MDIGRLVSGNFLRLCGVSSSMKTPTLVFVLALVASACIGSISPTSTSTTTTATMTTPPTTMPPTTTPATTTMAPTTTVTIPPTASPVAAALLELVTKDNTFGGGGSPFGVHLILDHFDPNAGWDVVTSASRELTAKERADVEKVFADVGEMQWIDNAEDWISAGLAPVLANSVILGVGEPRIEGSTAFVPMSLWCGGLCAIWFTYKLELTDGQWQVVGIDGSFAIS